MPMYYYCQLCDLACNLLVMPTRLLATWYRGRSNPLHDIAALTYTPDELYAFGEYSHNSSKPLRLQFYTAVSEVYRKLKSSLRKICGTRSSQYPTHLSVCKYLHTSTDEYGTTRTVCYRREGLRKEIKRAAKYWAHSRKPGFFTPSPIALSYDLNGQLSPAETCQFKQWLVERQGQKQGADVKSSWPYNVKSTVYSDEYISAYRRNHLRKEIATAKEKFNLGQTESSPYLLLQPYKTLVMEKGEFHLESMQSSSSKIVIHYCSISVDQEDVHDFDPYFPFNCNGEAWWFRIKRLAPPGTATVTLSPVLDSNPLSVCCPSRRHHSGWWMWR